MSKIADVVKLKTGYANFVELKKAFEAVRRMLTGWPCIGQPNLTVRLSERICRGLYQPNDKKFYLLSGPMAPANRISA